MGYSLIELEQMHVDGILTLICDKKLLERKGRNLVTGTPQQLKAMGLLDEIPKMSFVQMMRRKIEEHERRKKQDGV